MTHPIIFVETQMLVRKPAAEVFRAFIDPVVTSKFWFTKSSGILETNKKVRWEWEMYNVSAEVFVKKIVLNEAIIFDWQDPATTVEFSFTSQNDQATYVVIKEYGFQQTGVELINVIKDRTGGFTIVLDGLKAFLEHNIILNSIGDKYPKELTSHGKS